MKNTKTNMNFLMKIFNYIIIKSRSYIIFITFNITDRKLDDINAEKPDY